MRNTDEVQVNEFQKFRDEFFVCYPSASGDERKRALKEKATILMEDVPIATDLQGKVRNCLLCGKILNILPDYESKCEEYLSRAVKLDPSLVDAWNELGECLWKKGDMAAAKNCFQTALQKNRNSTSLRCLSVALRQEGTTAKEKREKIRESLDLAKEAVELDPNSGICWYMVANANLTYFFACGQMNAKLIDNALEAYQKSLDLQPDSKNADLYFNFAQALRYEQSYEKCLDCLKSSMLLDPSFTEAKDMHQNLVAYFCRMNECVQRKGKQKAKRLQEFCQSFNSVRDLGIYGDGYLQTNNNKRVKLSKKMISQLLPGPNPNSVLLCRVVGMVVNEDNIPYTFGVIDSDCDCVIMAVYNFSPKFGVTIGNSIACAEPFVVDVAVKPKEQELNFRCIRVSSPEILVINGCKLGKDTVAYCDAKVTMLET